MQGFAQTPAPPYYAVIFTSLRRVTDSDYREVAARMVALARQQPGFLGAESVRDADGFGVTISYWESEAAIAAWREDVEHRAAQARAAEFYSAFHVRVARVERDKNFFGDVS